MDRRFKRRLIFLMIGLAILLASCSRSAGSKYPVIELPPTPPVNIETNWGLVLASPLRLREGPSLDSRALASLWRGYVVEIFGQTSQGETIEGQNSYWYQVTYDGLQGWVFGAYLEIFNSKTDAERAARQRNVQ